MPEKMLKKMVDLVEIKTLIKGRRTELVQHIDKISKGPVATEVDWLYKGKLIAMIEILEMLDEKFN